MTSATRLLLAAALMVLVAGPAFAEADDGAVKPVKLAVAVQRKLGLVTQPLRAATRAATVSGFVKALDAGPLAQLDADIQAAQAAADASAAEAARSRTLNAADQAVSTKALQAAVAQARADASKLALLRRRVGLEWGPGVARLSAGQRSALLAEIAAGKAALVRIDTPSGQGLTGLRAAQIDMGALGSVRATVLGFARAADPRLMSPGLIAKASGPNAGALAAGLTLPVTLAAERAATGVMAPRSALLRSAGKTWVYVRTADDTFLRKEVDGAAPQADGLFAPAGFRPGEAVVTHGAAALFAAETNPAEPAGADGGDKDGD